MTKTIFKLFLSFLAFVTITNLTVNAQFYDSDDEVRIYVSDYVINHPGETVSAFVMNFNGAKAAILSNTGTAPGGGRNIDNKGFMWILNDDMYFEKRIYGEPNEVFNYDAERSTNSRICYSKVTSNDFVGMWGPNKFYSILLFSSDGNHVELSGNNYSGWKDKQKKFTKVSKEKLVELILANKNKGSERWR